MNNYKLLFTQLFMLVLILEFTFYALLQTGNIYYLPGIVISTAGIFYISFVLFQLNYSKRSVHKNYNFFIEGTRPAEEIFIEQLNRRL